MQNGKGSKRRPESQHGKYIQNYDEINWSKDSSNLIERAVLWVINKSKEAQSTASEDTSQKGEK